MFIQSMIDTDRAPEIVWCDSTEDDLDGVFVLNLFFSH